MLPQIDKEETRHTTASLVVVALFGPEHRFIKVGIRMTVKDKALDDQKFSTARSRIRLRNRHFLTSFLLKSVPMRSDPLVIFFICHPLIITTHVSEPPDKANDNWYQTDKEDKCQEQILE